MTKQLWALRALRKMSPSGVNGQILRSVISSQKVCSWRSRCFGGLPAMIAELMAPIETPRHPVRLDAGLVHRLIDAGLIGAERAAALQHQGDAVAAVRSPAPPDDRAGCEGSVSQARRNVVHGVITRNG